MRIGNQAALQELAERINQADAVVIGGGSGLSSAPDTTTTIGLRHFRRHWLPFANSMASPPAGWILPLLFQLWGTVGVLQPIYALPVGSPYRAALFGPTGACCG